MSTIARARLRRFRGPSVIAFLIAIFLLSSMSPAASASTPPHRSVASATGTFQNWRDVADFAIETVTVDPDVSAPAGGNQLCLSRVVFLNNRQTGQLVRQQIVRVYIDAPTRNINSAHPRERQC